MESIKLKGLDAFQVKIIALILMTFDHIHYMFSGTLDVPMWFTIIGRVSAPLFIFMVANGMHYTHSREKYLAKLYIGFVGMNYLNSFFGAYFPHPGGAMLIANIFSTLFLICLLIYAGGKIKHSIIGKKFGKAFGFLILALLPFASSVVLISVMKGETQFLSRYMGIIMNFIPSILLTEGGFMFVILGVGFYLCGKSKIKQSIFYVIYCASLFFMNMGSGVTLEQLFTTNIQWFMIFALPIILLYNNNKGKSMKYFFYLYYPIHMYLLLILARFVAQSIN